MSSMFNPHVVYNIRSGPSRVSVLLVIRNRTCKNVAMYWIDHRGCEQWYATLKPREVLRICTYEGHVWLSRDPDTLRNFLIAGQEIYVVKLDTEKLRNEKKISVVITSPVFKLEELCIDEVMKKMKTPTDIFSLDLPRRTSQDLLKIWMLKNYYYEYFT